MFKYNYLTDIIKKMIICDPVPLQVELHPSTNCGAYNCKFCYGCQQELNVEESLSLDDYKKLFRDIQGKVKFITISGIKSEPENTPKLYEIIKQVKEHDFRLGVHTKGFLLKPELSDLIVTDTTYGDFITFSIDASDGTIYNYLHGLPENSAHFEKMVKNISYLYGRKKNTHSELNINVSYLLFRDNAALAQMERFIHIFSNISDRIRFSVPQLPNKIFDTLNYYLDAKTLQQTRGIIKHLQEKYSHLNITFLDFEDSAHKTDFKFCYAQALQAVVDHTGFVYPCPQIATKQFKQLTYGNIKDKNFWQIWNSNQRKRILNLQVCQMDCRVCDRKDETLNVKLSQLFNNESLRVSSYK